MHTHQRKPCNVERTIRPLPASVARLDLSNVKSKLRSPDGKRWDEATADLAEREYKRFLVLRVENPRLPIVPTKFIDEMWHAHILDTKAYHQDCADVFGYYLHHFPYFGTRGGNDHARLLNAFEVTQRLYLERFGEDLVEQSCARCAGHACHAPSSCGCRTPGACK